MFAQRAWCVAKAWLRKPSQVATICPSSSHLTQKLAERDCVRTASVIVELGPGEGGTSLALLQQMPAQSRLLVIEKTSEFREALQQISDSRFEYVIGDAADLRQIVSARDLGSIDVIVSGIPFSAIADVTARSIMQSIYEVLRPGGFFIAYQLRSDVEEFARPYFGTGQSETVPLNLPPLRVYWWQKAC